MISAYTPQQVRVVYSEQEDLTIIAWQLGDQVDTSEVRFELSLNGTWNPVNFDASPYPAGEYNCSNTCFQLNFPGKYTAPLDGIVIRSLHPQHGTLLGTKASVQVQKVTLSFGPRMKAGNHNTNLQVQDFFNQIGTPEKRTYQYRFFNSSTFPCPTELTGNWTGQSQGADPVFYPLGSDQEYVCTVLRPLPRKSIKPVTLSALLWMHPELQSRNVTYKVPVETSPVLYQLLFDLQIPDDGHCLQTIQTIQRTVAAAFDARNGEHHGFDAVNIADDGVKHCNQRPDRRFQAVDLAEMLKSYVNTSVQQPRGARIVIAYINNNTLSLPQPLLSDFATLGTSLLQDPRVHIFTWGIGTDTLLKGQQWDAGTGWITPSNSAFKEQVTALANSTLPFKSLDHQNEELITFLDPIFEGIAGQFKSCSSTPTVQYYVNGQFAYPPAGTAAYTLNLGDQLRFQVSFDPQEFAKSSEFIDQKVLIRYEICTKWCNHPFYSAKDEWIGSLQDTGASPGSPHGWDQEARCREAP